MENKNDMFLVKVRAKVELVNCSSNNKKINIGDKVIFQDHDEKKYGIVISLQPLIEKNTSLPIIIDTSSMHSIDDLSNIADYEKEVLEFCKERAKNYKLDMDFLKSECSLDMSKVTVYFMANTRIDFRELVKDVNNMLKGRSKLELWQINSREKALILGGLGVCGREICCRLIGKFPDSVSIRSVKDQGLEINPSKITGPCGKLMCCLTYEHTQYIEMAENFPKEGTKVSVNGKTGTVKANNIIKNTITIEFNDSITVELNREELLISDNQSI